jgi:DNA-binding MarR family transcriptional regulator
MAFACNNIMEIRDARNKEWFWLDNQYLNGYAKHLGSLCTVVYISLCRHADNKTQTCFPSMETIAEENGISEKSVSRAIKTLEKWSIIDIKESYNKKTKRRENNVYTLLAKKEWKEKPPDSQSSGNKESHQTHSPKPPDNDAKSHQTVVPSNNTNTINNTHNNNTNSKVVTLRGNEWNQLIDKFKPLNPTYEEFYKNTTERKALDYLVGKFGFEKVSGMLDKLPEITSQPYAPKITKPSELKRDLGKLIIFYKQSEKKVTENKYQVTQKF